MDGYRLWCVPSLALCVIALTGCAATPERCSSDKPSFLALMSCQGHWEDEVVAAKVEAQVAQREVNQLTQEHSDNQQLKEQLTIEANALGQEVSSMKLRLDTLLRGSSVTAKRHQKMKQQIAEIQNETEMLKQEIDSTNNDQATIEELIILLKEVETKRDRLLEELEYIEG